MCTIGNTSEIMEVPFIFMGDVVFCSDHSVSQFITTAANAKQGTSSHTVNVVLHLFLDVLMHHCSVFLQRVQLQALLLHPLLVKLKLFLQP